MTLSQELKDRIFKRRIKTGILNITKFLTKGVITISLAYFLVYFGAGAFVKQMDLQDCTDFKNYESQYPNSVSKEQINRCSVIGVELR